MSISLLRLMILDDHRELRRIDVRQLGTIAVTTTDNSLLSIIIVSTRKEVTKNELGIPETFLFVHADTDSTEGSIVLNGHCT